MSYYSLSGQFINKQRVKENWVDTTSNKSNTKIFACGKNICGTSSNGQTYMCKAPCDGYSWEPVTKDVVDSLDIDRLNTRLTNLTQSNKDCEQKYGDVYKLSQEKDTNVQNIQTKLTEMTNANEQCKTIVAKTGSSTDAKVNELQNKLSDQIAKEKVEYNLLQQKLDAQSTQYKADYATLQAKASSSNVCDTYETNYQKGITPNPIPVDCYSKKWKETCLTPVPQGNIDWLATAKPSREDVIGHLNTWANDKSRVFREGCYGPDQGKWPGTCDTLDYKSTCKDDQLISRKVYQKIWNDVGCTTPNSGNEWVDKQTLGGLIADSRAWATMTDDDHRRGCYGPDKSKWPDNNIVSGIIGKSSGLESIVKGGLGGNTTENVTLAGGVSGIIGKSSGLENFALVLVTTDGSIYYADTNILSGTPNYTRVGGALTNVSYSKGKVMGVNSAGNIYYNENYRTGGWQSVNGGLSNVSLDSNTGVVMGVNSAGNIYYNDNYKSSNWVQIPGGLMNISYSNSQCYGVNSGQQILYNPNYRSGGWILIPGSLVQVNFNANDNVVVGVNSNDDIFIATKNITNTKIEWQQIPNKLINVNYHNGQLMGVNRKGDILYKPDITIQNNWVDITDTLRGKNVRQISFGGRYV